MGNRHRYEDGEYEGQGGRVVRYEESKRYNKKKKKEIRPDPGSVQDCYKCKLAFYSKWETDKPWSWKKAKPDPEDLVCARCNTQELFDRNIAKLEAQESSLLRA